MEERKLYEYETRLNLEGELVDFHLSTESHWIGLVKINADLFIVKDGLKEKFKPYEDGYQIRSITKESAIIYNNSSEKEENGWIVNFKTKTILNLKLGWGISDVYCLNNKILISYIDESHYANDSYSSQGLVLLNDNGSFEKGGSEYWYENESTPFCIEFYYPINEKELILSESESFGILNIETFSTKYIEINTNRQIPLAMTGDGKEHIFQDSQGEIKFIQNQTGKIETIKKYSSKLKGIGNNKFYTFGTNGYTIIEIE